MALWRPLLQVSTTTWAGVIDTDSTEVWVGDHDAARRQLDADAPVGLLPLLEQRRAAVLSELAGRRADGFPLFASTLATLLDSTVDLAIAGPGGYWPALTLAWISEAGPTEHTRRQLTGLAERPASEQSLRHQARRLLRLWS